MARASDDFYPKESASSHPHVAACAFNSVFLSALVQPDWDMFHSQHPAAELHALARAVSGGPVYVSDFPGKHNFDVLRCAGLAHDLLYTHMQKLSPMHAPVQLP